jgi:nucleotide-binding universal stress UspA family protein
MPDAISHLLVPTDFRPASREAVRLALEMAFGSRARLTLLHVIPEEPLDGLDAIGYLHRALWAPDGPGGYVPGAQHPDARYRPILDRLERELHPEWRRSLAICTAVRCGSVAAEVARYAREEAADLIVVGVNRLGWRFSLRLRRSEQIVRLADRPVVLVLPAPGPARPVPAVQPHPA